MAKRQVEVDDAEIAAAEKRLEQQIEDEVQARVKAKEPAPMDADIKARLEAADKKASDAATEAAALKARLEALEKCRTEQEGDEKARLEEEAKETLRMATAIAETRVPTARVEAEAKRLAAMGRDAVVEIARATPAPAADPLLSVMRREAAAAGKPAQRHYARREEEAPDGTVTMALTVTDWTKHGAEAPAGHKTARLTEVMR